MGIVYGAILPHGPDIILEIAKDVSLMAETRSAMEEAGRRIAAARVETVILLDPDLVHRQNKSATRTLYAGPGELSVGVAARAGGILGTTRESFECDVALAEGIVDEGRRQGFPVAAAPEENGELPLVGGALIPLWYTVRAVAAGRRPGVVVIAPSPAVPRKELWRFGKFLVELAGKSRKRVGLIASADQGHTHDKNHAKFGYSPAAAEFDALYCKAVKENHLERLMEVSDQMLKDSWADSLWMTLILAGAMEAAALRGEMLSYARPTYFGMVVAVYEPGPRG